MHAAHLMEKAQQWIAATHPRYWQRRGGRDHIWTNVNDEGGCHLILSSACVVCISILFGWLQMNCPAGDDRPDTP